MPDEARAANGNAMAADSLRCRAAPVYCPEACLIGLHAHPGIQGARMPLPQGGGHWRRWSALRRWLA